MVLDMRVGIQYTSLACKNTLYGVPKCGVGTLFLVEVLFWVSTCVPIDGGPTISDFRAKCQS